MRFLPIGIHGAARIEADAHFDERGLFARLYCAEAFRSEGLGAFNPVQMNISRNRFRRTLRGLHFQPPPFAEAKLVRVVSGRVQDVIVDMRPESPTYKQWIGMELDATAMAALFIPEGCAHGFLTLEDDTDVLYQMGRLHEPGHGYGIRWNDPVLAVNWAETPLVMTERDATWDDWQG